MFCSERSKCSPCCPCRTACQLEKLTVAVFHINQYDVPSLVGYSDFWGNGASIWEFVISDIYNNEFATLSVHLLHDVL